MATTVVLSFTISRTCKYLPTDKLHHVLQLLFRTKNKTSPLYSIAIRPRTLLYHTLEEAEKTNCSKMRLEPAPMRERRIAVLYPYIDRTPASEEI